MLTLFASLITNPLSRKILLYSGLVLTLLLGLRWYSNKAYSDGRSEGVKTTLSESITSSKKNWEADLATLQSKIDANNVVASQSAHAAADAAAKVQSVIELSAAARTAIVQQTAQIPVANLPAAIVANDATVKPADVVDLERHLLASQTAVQSLDTEVREILKSHKDYVEQTTAQITALNDTLTATQGQLHVMTVERDAYKASFEAATKKRGCGTFKKIFTLGVCR